MTSRVLVPVFLMLAMSLALVGTASAAVCPGGAGPTCIELRVENPPSAVNTPTFTDGATVQTWPTPGVPGCLPDVTPNWPGALVAVDATAPVAPPVQLCYSNILPEGSTAVTVNVPAGIGFTLNSVNYTGSQTVNLAEGNYTLATTTPQTLAAGSQAVFQSWSDAGAISHTITVAASPLTVTGTFATQYQLTTAAGAGGTVSPASGSFFDSGSIVNVTATPDSGFVFASWTGPVADANAAATTVTMDAAKSITANFEGAVSHFQGYDVDNGKSTRLPTKPVVDLEDQFGVQERVAVADRPDFMFTPVDKNGEGIVDADDQLACYPIKGLKVDRKVLIENQFGQQTLKLKEGKLVCVPSAMAEAPPAPLPPVDPPLDSFKCYNVDKGQSTRLAVDPVVRLTDRFGLVEGVEVEDRPKYLCNPVDVDGQGIANADDHLACYSIKGGKANRDVLIANEFGNQSLRLKDGKLLCVPSSKTEL